MTTTGAATTADIGETSKRERNKAEKHRRIVAAARRLFEDKGFEAATTAEISAAAGIGTGTLYLYVDSKEDLLVEVFLGDAREAWAEAIGLIEPKGSLAEQLTAAFVHVAESHLSHPTLSRAAFRELPFTTGDVRERCSAFQQELDARLAGVLAEAQKSGRLAVEIDCQTLAINLFAAWHLRMQRSLGRGGQLELGPSIERSIRTALAGIT